MRPTATDDDPEIGASGTQVQPTAHIAPAGTKHSPLWAASQLELLQQHMEAFVAAGAKSKSAKVEARKEVLRTVYRELKCLDQNMSEEEYGILKEVRSASYNVLK